MSSVPQDKLAEAKNCAYRLLSYRSRSIKELTDRLERKKFPKTVIQKVIKDLEKLKFLDDRQFSKTFLESRFSRNPCGRRLVVQELRKKGIAEEIIAETCDEAFSQDKEHELAFSLAARKVGRCKNHDEKDKRKKLYSLLGRRGFSLELIHEVAEEVLGSDEKVGS